VVATTRFGDTTGYRSLGPSGRDPVARRCGEVARAPPQPWVASERWVGSEGVVQRVGLKGVVLRALSEGGEGRGGTRWRSTHVVTLFY
jgi:hypothetical protein